MTATDGGSRYGGNSLYYVWNNGATVGRFAHVNTAGAQAWGLRSGVVNFQTLTASTGQSVMGVSAGLNHVAVGGIVLVAAGGAFNPGDVVMSDSVGRAVAWTGGANLPAARALEGASTAGQEVLVTMLDYPGAELPVVSGGDNGKTLTVSSGAWAAVAPLVAGTSGHLSVTSPGNPTTSITSGGTASTANAGGTGDFAGVLTLFSGTGAGFTTSTVIRVTFANAYGAAPAVFVQSREAASAGIWYVSNVTATYWEVKPNASIAASNTHNLSYLVV